MPNLTQHYQQYVQDHDFQTDAAQATIIEHLEKLQSQLEKPAFLFRKPIFGCYLWGGVGRGKTFLMDLFFQHTHLKQKKRIHFHRFMKEIHQQIQAAYGKTDTIHKIAKQMRTQTKLLCLDELYVEDVADAMILVKLLTTLIQQGIILVITSNLPPEKLYLGGLQRELFEPVIDTLNHHLHILNLDTQEDYRYLHAAADREHNQLSKVFDEWTDQHHPEEIQSNKHIIVEGRQIATLKHTHNVVWFRFSDICGYGRGVNDYIYIANHYQILLLQEIPIFTEARDDEARRFIALVDECYDNQVKLILHLEIPLTQLYQGKRLQFAFERTISRLTEMNLR